MGIGTHKVFAGVLRTLRPHTTIKFRRIADLASQIAAVRGPNNSSRTLIIQTPCMGETTGSGADSAAPKSPKTAPFTCFLPKAHFYSDFFNSFAAEQAARAGGTSFCALTKQSNRAIRSGGCQDKARRMLAAKREHSRAPSALPRGATARAACRIEPPACRQAGRRNRQAAKAHCACRQARAKAEARASTENRRQDHRRKAAKTRTFAAPGCTYKFARGLRVVVNGSSCPSFFF